MTGLWRLATNAPMYKAARTRARPPQTVRLPLRVPLSRLKGATPTRAAICRRSSVPSSGVVADHLWLRYGPWANELASGLQVGARITFDAVVTRYVKGYTGDDPVRQAARPRNWITGWRRFKPSVATATVGLGELPGLRSVLAMRWGYCYAKKAEA